MAHDLRTFRIVFRLENGGVLRLERRVRLTAAAIDELGLGNLLWHEREHTIADTLVMDGLRIVPSELHELVETKNLDTGETAIWERPLLLNIPGKPSCVWWDDVSLHRSPERWP